jgi:predicted metal-dependent enzyme (double-stranded beta helix superfamily)
MTEFNLDLFVSQLRTAASESDAKSRVRKLMDEAFKNPAVIKAAMPEYSDDDVLLFEDETVSIWVVRFVPDLHVPPHDHQTTATIGVYDGAEINHFYLRQADLLVRKTSKRVGPGDVISIKPEGIHSVVAADSSYCCGIHVYLGPLTTIERSLFDWESGEPCPYTDDNYDQMKRVSSN